MNKGELPIHFAEQFCLVKNPFIFLPSSYFQLYKAIKIVGIPSVVTKVTYKPQKRRNLSCKMNGG
jgi:hypothetical protein